MMGKREKKKGKGRKRGKKPLMRWSFRPPSDLKGDWKESAIERIRKKVLERKKRPTRAIWKAVIFAMTKVGRKIRGTGPVLEGSWEKEKERVSFSKEKQRPPMQSRPHRRRKGRGHVLILKRKKWWREEERTADLLSMKKSLFVQLDLG